MKLPSRPQSAIKPLRFGTALLAALSTLQLTSMQTTHAQTQPAAMRNGLEMPKPEGQRIDKITIIGAKSLSPSVITVMSGHQTGDSCTPTTIEEIRQNLIHTGLFGMHNTNDPEEWVRVRMDTANSPQGHCELLIVVDENDSMQQASITGSGPISPDEILSYLHLNTIYNSEQTKRDLHTIQDLYTKRGYVMVFGEDLGPDLDHPGVLNIPLVVARVRDIRVEGNKTTRAFVIRREMNTREGGYFCRYTLENDLGKLSNLGLFADIDPQVTPVSPGEMSILLKVKEKKVGSYNFGASEGGGKLAGFVEVSENNLRGQGETLGIHIESGINAATHSYQASFIEPWIDRRHTSLSVNVFDTTASLFANGLLGNVSTSTSNAYLQKKTGGSLGLNRLLSNHYALSLSLRGESDRTDSLLLSGINAAALQNGPVFFSGATLTHNTRDQNDDPVGGSLQALSVGIGHANLQAVLPQPDQPDVFGSRTFAKSTIEWQHFINLQAPRRPGHPDDERRSLAFRFQAGSSMGTLPFTEQFFVGGDDTLRGYPDSRFWGSNMTTGTVELRQPIARGFKGVLFADAGDAWGGTYQDVSLQGYGQSSFHIHASTGVGVRVGTPLGLIRLDYGYGDEGGRVHFGVGYHF